MSDLLKHECGIAFLRLLKPISYYKEKYGTDFYGLKKMYLLLEKQHNRGQDGAGLASIKFDTKLGKAYIDRERSKDKQPIKDLIDKINIVNNSIIKQEINPSLDWIKDNVPFSGELFLGHVRYGTYGANTIENIHPFIRKNNWKNRNLVMAGNFNMTNVDELVDDLVNIGQHPHILADTLTIMEKFGHYLDEEVEIRYREAKLKGISKIDASKYIDEKIDLKELIKKSVKKFDGGYVLCGLIGNGDSFILRDSLGIRPAFYYKDDEILVSASERPVIQTAFNLSYDKIKEIPEGSAIICKKNGDIKIEQILEKKEPRHCSFERIYFSRGNDKDIYKERKYMGKYLFRNILKAIDNDIENTVFSYIPNTAEISFFGLIESVTEELNKHKCSRIMNLDHKTKENIDLILSQKVRMEKIAIKDAKLRTFISEDTGRDEMVEHIYDVTYGVVKPTDNLVVIDDSIVRGTTLKNSIIRILDRLSPKKIIIVSSAPQVRYPDCYGIDMAKISDFIAFRACIELLKERGMGYIIDETYKKAKLQQNKSKSEIVNCVKDIYTPFSYEDISNKIAELVKDKDIKAEVKIIFQSIEDLHKSTQSKGDWYFSGDYPTHGGNKVVNQAFINFIEGNHKRAY